MADTRTPADENDMIQHEDHPSTRDSNCVSLFDRFYTFTVICAALLFLGLALWPFSKNKMSVVESVWNYDRGTASPLSAEEVGNITYAIKSPDSIRAAIETVSPSIEERNYSVWQEKVAESVAVMVEPDRNSYTNVNVRVRAGGNSEDFCRELVGALQDQFQQRYHKPVDHSAVAKAREKLEQDVVTALKAVDKQQVAIDNFLREKMKQARTVMESRSKKTTSNVPLLAPPTATATAVPRIDPPASDVKRNKLPKIETANPEYLALQAEIQELESRELILGSPTNDPTSSTNSLDSLRARLSETPRSIPTDENWVSNPFSSDAESAAIANPFVKASEEIVPSITLDPPEVAEADELALNREFDAYAVEQSIRNGPEYRRLLQQLDHSKRSHLAALDTLKSPSLDSMKSSQTVNLVQPPQVVSRFRSGLEWPTIWKLLVPSALAGLVCAMFSATQKNPQTIFSQNDAKSSLNLPVLGTITTDFGPTIQYPYSAQRPWARWSRHAAEVVLVVSLLAIIYALATFDGFSNMLAKDPFAGFMTAVDQVKGLLVKQG